MPTTPILIEKMSLSSRSTGAVNTDANTGRPAHAAPNWMDVVTGAGVLDLPIANPRPETLGPDVNAVELAIAPATIARARSMVAESGGDATAVLLAAWQALLFRYTDQSDTVLGCARVPRADGDDDSVVLLHLRPSASLTFRELVVRSQAEASAQRLAEAPSFRAVLQALQVEASAVRHPVFQTAFVIRDKGSSTVEGRPSISDGCAPCDVALACFDHGTTVEAAIEFPPSLFDRTRIERMGLHFVRLLAGAVASPDTELGHLPLLEDTETSELERLNATAASHDAGLPLAAMLCEQVQRTPEAIALESGDTRLSFAQLNARANRLAHTLRSRGVGPDVTVAISLDRSIEMIVAVLGVIKSGGAYVPIDPAYPTARRSYMLADSKARVLITDALLLAAFGEFKGDVLCVDRDAAAIAAAPEMEPQVHATGASIAYVIYTSGSTGQPKGVALPQRALTNLTAWQVSRPRFAAGARTLQFSSLSFDVSFQEIAATWCSGGTLVLVSETVRRDSRALLDHLVAHRVQRIFLPFVALRGLAEAAVTRGVSPTSLSEVYTAGEQLQVDDTIRRFFAELPGCLLENQYGPSEAHVVTAGPLTGEPATWPALPGIGTPIANTVIRILDARRQPRPIGLPGELYIGGVCLAHGYLGRTEMTEERFVTVSRPDGSHERLYRTGDLARWMPDGTIQFHGRIDHQVKFRGYRIEPGEVAANLADHPDVSRCVAQIRTVDHAGQRLVAYFSPRDGRRVSTASLHAFARKRLPDYMVPTHFVALAAFPLTPSGKVDTKALPEPHFDRGVLSRDFVAPGTPEELALARIWSRLLAITEIGIHDDFFELGGDSLISVELFSEIRREFGRDLPIGVLARGPTIEALARLLSTGDRTNVWGCLVPIQPEGKRTPLFCVHGGAGNVASFPKLARQLPKDQPFYGLQWNGLDGTRGHRTIPQMAAHYLRAVRTVQPHGPYLFAGQCIGGLIAIEMARLTLAAGEPVDRIIMFDTPNVSSPLFQESPRVPLWKETVRHRFNRKAHYTFFLQHTLGLRVLPQRRFEHAGRTMMAAVWKFRMPEVPVPIVLFCTGITDGKYLGLPGTWSDNAMGWSPRFGPQFTFVAARGEHNDMLYAPEVAARVAAELQAAQNRTLGGVGADVPR